MGVSSALYSGVSGLNANANAMSVIGDNLANANTIGFKSSRTVFGDLLSSQISGSGGTSQIGRGVGLSTIDSIFSQGTFENSETNTDLAVEGSGFFIVSDPAMGNTSSNYTRAGAFRFSAEGFLVNPEGFNVMGYELDADGNTVGDLTPIWANTQTFTPAGPTAGIDLNINLNSDSIEIPAGFDRFDPSGTSNYATSIQCFDSLGSTHLMTTYFTKTSPLNWDWNTVVDGGELAGGTPGDLTVVGSGALIFDASGDLTVPHPMATVTVPAWSNGSMPNQQIDIDMQTSQYASPSVIVSQEQDGFRSGTLVKLSVDESGNIVGNFSNGSPRLLMRIPLAKFTNPSSLTRIGSNMYAQSTDSGTPVIGTVGSGVGSIFTNALELSNVDMAQEFVKMITTQRGFSANSKTITTTDEMLAEVINMKR